MIKCGPTEQGGQRLAPLAKSGWGLSGRGVYVFHASREKNTNRSQKFSRVARKAKNFDFLSLFSCA